MIIGAKALALGGKPGDIPRFVPSNIDIYYVYKYIDGYFYIKTNGMNTRNIIYDKIPYIIKVKWKLANNEVNW